MIIMDDVFNNHDWIMRRLPWQSLRNFLVGSRGIRILPSKFLNWLSSDLDGFGRGKLRGDTHTLRREGTITPRTRPVYAAPNHEAFSVLARCCVETFRG